VHHQFPIAIDGRDAVMASLAVRGIGAAVHYAPPVHLQPAFARYVTEPLPVTESHASRLLSLPIQPEVAGPNREAIMEAVVEVLGDA
jgi:dTDP-4-amino-4,6-dideoxygalactose transaminase